jgi:ParB family chromosome partitioning protein
MAKQALGKGFDILIPKDVDTTILEEDKHRVQKILIEDIVPNAEQPRREFDEQQLSELASKNAGLTHVPAIVRSLEELERVELALIENIQRVDLSPLEQALSVYKLQQQFNLALEDVAKKLGKAPSTISNLTRLLQLPDAAREALRDGKISEGHARAILALKGNESKQNELLRCILDNGWSVRQAEQFVTSTKKGATSDKARGATSSENNLTKDLSVSLGTQVKLKHTAKGGQLIISFKTEDELSSLAAKILNKN